ncbi:MAG: hypothetical protein JW740_02195 [Candidatus Zambryskibacteria bacterium]|nr:hypothetical protein [Candidatus Zambryskibacteria bacterium]
MTKIQFSDVTPPEKRSIRNIPVPENRRRKITPQIIKPGEKIPEENENILENKGDAYEYYYPKSHEETDQYGSIKKSSRKKWVIGSVIIIIIMAIFVVSMMTVFSSATVRIIPKNQKVIVDMEITTSSKDLEGAVRHEIIKLSKSKTAPVLATGEEDTEIKASGKIIIYNNYSSASQRLIIRTRFESPEGLIYRIPESIVVPGKKGDLPGSIEIEVFADEAGEKYNIDKVDFTIPGFKNDPSRYEGFYARSITPITGGFIGKRKTITEADREAALKNVEDGVQIELQKELASKVPDGLSLLPSSIIYESKELPPKEDGSSVIVGKEITAYAMMFDTKDLSSKIVDSYISESEDWQNIEAEVNDFSALNIFQIPEDFETDKEFDLKLNGEVNVVAKINKDLINQRLLGISKDNITDLMNEFEGISSITSAVRPIWKNSFPKDSFKIHVKIDSEE